MTRRRRTTPRQPGPPQLTANQAVELAGQLLRELTEHAGDREAVNRVMQRWVDTDMHRLSLVCMAAVQRIFAECLHPIPTADAPPGALELIPPQEERPRP